MNESNIQTEIDADGVLLARIDMPGRSMNVFSRGLMDALEQLIDRVEQDAAVKAVVLTSGKSAFLAGADLDMIRMFTERARTDTSEQLHELCGHLGRLFRRIELSRKPYVAAINGLALGGGLEVCLACHARVVVDDPAIQLGLPEIKLGLLPGAGGTQRLPRLVGISKGLSMLLSGDSVSARDASAIGLVDELASREQLLEVAKRRALSASTMVAPWDQPGASFDSAPFDFTRMAAFDAIASALNLSDYQLQRYPAYEAIMDCVVGGWNLPMTEASDREMDIFVELIRDPVAGNMVRTLFLNRQKATKLGLLAADGPLATTLLQRLGAARDRARALGCDEDEILLATAFAGVRSWQEGEVAQPELADVAAVLGGLYPAFAGGPFTYVKQQGADALQTRAAVAASKDADLFAVPAQLQQLLAQGLQAAA